MVVLDQTPNGLILSFDGLQYEIYMDDNGVVHITDVERRELHRSETQLVWNQIRRHLVDL